MRVTAIATAVPAICVSIASSQCESAPVLRAKARSLSNLERRAVRPGCDTLKLAVRRSKNVRRSDALSVNNLSSRGVIHTIRKCFARSDNGAFSPSIFARRLVSSPIYVTDNSVSLDRFEKIQKPPLPVKRASSPIVAPRIPRSPPSIDIASSMAVLPAPFGPVIIIF